MNSFISRLSQNQRLFIVGIAGFIAGTALTSILFLAQPETVPVRDTNVSDAAVSSIDSADQAATAVTATGMVSNGEDRVSVDDQSAGSVVRVTSATLAASSWIAVHEDADGKLGNVLGAVRLDQGTSQTTITLLRPTRVAQTYHIRIYRDDGDRTFDLETDQLLVDAADTPVGDSFETTQ